MVEGQTDDIRQSTNVVATQPDQLLGAAADLGEKVLDQAAQSQIQANSSKAQIAVANLQNQYQIDNQGDPTANLAQYQKQRQTLLDQFKPSNAFYNQDWNEKSQNLADNNDDAMNVWAIRQSKENVVQNVNQSLKDNFLLANQNGMQYGNGQGDIDSFLNFTEAKKNISEFATEHLGATTTASMLMDYNKDYAKSFISGVAQSNPQKAAQLMSDPRVTSQFTTEQQDEMVQLIKTTDKRQQLQKSFAEGSNQADVMDIINDPTMNYFQKRQKIDEMDVQGGLSSKAAASARRLLTSDKNVDSVTDEATMSDIITQTSDLNATPGISNGDYLTGIKNIQTKIMDAQSAGKLNVIDAKKLSNQIRSLTAAKVAGASGSVGNDFYDANQVFKDLPPEMRLGATRQLFYAQTDPQQSGQPAPSKADLVAKAHGIVDNMNQQRRTNAQAVITKVNPPAGFTAGGGLSQGPLSQDDMDFVKTKGFTQDDVNETATRYGMNPQDVVKKLRDGK